MAQYIDKSALVAYINNWIEDARHRFTMSRVQFSLSDRIESLENLLSFLDTLEVKEVDLDFILHEYWKLSSKITIDCLESATMTKDEMINFAKHFFELGLKAQKGE